jgi:putative PIN family toxin of toxin-antitoxin system
LKVVIDTNIFVSSFLGGRPRQVIDLWKRGEVVLCLSKDILDEYVDVLQRVGIGPKEGLEELLALFKKNINIIFTLKTPRLPIVEDDPSDDKFIECAVKLKADFIITGDKALRRVKQYLGIRILSPQEFLMVIDKNRP